MGRCVPRMSRCVSGASEMHPANEEGHRAFGGPLSSIGVV